jgi:DNA repair exonuclease SbcCD ATPase subunit
MSISNMDLDFDNKVVLISGENGSGKSSIVDAISLCFISKKRSVSYQDYVQQGKEFAKIILDCEVNNEPVHFDIQLNLIKGNPFQIALTYKNQIYNNKETEQIIDSFGMGYYADIIFSMQNDADITEFTPAQRAYYLQKLLNFDFEEQKTKLKKDLDSFDDIIKTNNIEIPLKENSLKREQDSIEELKIVQQTEEEIKELQESIIEKETAFKEAEKNLDILTELNTKISSINKDIFTKRESVSFLDNNIKSMKSNIEENNRILEKEKHLLTLEKENKSKIFANNKIIADNEQLVAEIDNELKDLNSSYSILLGLKYEIERLDKLYDDGKCPHCGQETKGAAENQYVKYISSQKVPEGLLVNISSILECKEEILTRMLEYGKLVNEKEKERVALLETNTSKKASTMNYEREIKENFAIITLGKGRIKNLCTQEDIDKSTKKLEDESNILSLLLTEKEKVQTHIDSYSKIKITDLSKEIELLKNQVFSYNSLIATNNEIKKRNEKRNDNILSIQKEIEELKQRNIDVIKQKDSYEEAYKIFDKDLPNFMSIKACATLQENINDFIQNIFPNYEVSLQASKKGCEFFYTKDASIKASRKKNNYLLNAKMSSGFEKALLTLAFKISLAELYGCNCLFLDEADKSADEENTQLLYEHLVNLNTFDQIFLITHKDTMKELIINNYQAKVFEIEKGKLI